MCARALHAYRMTAVKATAAVAPEQRCWCGVDSPQPPRGGSDLSLSSSTPGRAPVGAERRDAQTRPHLSDGLIGEQVGKETTCSQLHHGRPGARARTDRQTDRQHEISRRPRRCSYCRSARLERLIARLSGARGQLPRSIHVAPGRTDRCPSLRAAAARPPPLLHLSAPRCQGARQEVLHAPWGAVISSSAPIGLLPSTPPPSTSPWRAVRRWRFPTLTACAGGGAVDAPAAVVPRVQMLCCFDLLSLTVSPPGLWARVTGLQNDENEAEDENEELFPCSDRRPVRNSYINAENKH